MSTAAIHSMMGGIPLLVVAILAALIFSRKGNHPATYQLSEPWTHGPILWAAVNEVVPGDGHHGHGSDSESVGGGASGKW